MVSPVFGALIALENFSAKFNASSQFAPFLSAIAI
jgi:hypothetical protein